MHKRYLLENKTTYKDNENTAQFFRFLTGMDINIAEMYQSDDSLCNEIIAHNEYLNSFEHRNLLEGLNISKTTMESFCKSVYYGNKCWFLHSDSGRLSTLFGMLLSYAIGNFDKSQLIKELKYRENKGRLGIFAYDRFFYRLSKRVFFEIEKHYEEIRIKQLEREERQEINYYVREGYL